jgi:hypothetical protein
MTCGEGFLLGYIECHVVKTTGQLLFEKLPRVSDSDLGRSRGVGIMGGFRSEGSRIKLINGMIR